MKAYWKPAVLVLVVLGVVAFAAYRFRAAFVGGAPPFMKVQEISSPALWSDSRLRHSWAHFERMLKQAGLESSSLHVGIRALTFIDVAEDVRRTVVWEMAEIINPGFAPMERAEGMVPQDPKQFLGYYSADGKPLPYIVKLDPRRPNQRPTTIVLAQPVAPGQTGMVFSAQYRTDSMADEGGDTRITGWVLDMPYLPGPEQGIRGFGVNVPAGAQIREYAPSDEAFQVRHDDGVLTMWFNSVLSPHDRPTIRFHLKK